MYQRFVDPEAQPYEEEADTHAKQLARNQLLMAKQAHDQNAINAAMKAGREAGLSHKYLGEVGRVST